MIEIKINSKKERFLKKLNQNNINVYKINKDKILVDKKDLEKIQELITIYDVEIIGKKYTLKKLNKIFITSIIISILFLYLLSKIIFDINIITEDVEIHNLLKSELEKYNIKEHTFKKNNLEEITKKIIEDNKEKIEWLYIEEIGTTYNVKVQIRKIKQEEKEQKPSHIIAKKNAVIKRIIASSGEILKLEGQYVRKGEIIVTGEIKLYEEIKSITSAKGNVYGEVWYKISIEQPLIYYGKINNKKTNINFFFLNKTYTFKGEKEENRLKTIIPIGLQISEEPEKEISTILTIEEAKELAIKNARNKIESKLNDKEYILYEKMLKQDVNDSKIELEIFYAVYEDITEYKEVE